MKKVFICLLLFLLFPLSVYGNNKVKVVFDSCVDGDTAYFIMNDERIKVRFLAIDTPETKHPTKGTEPYGPEASDYTCNALKNSKSIYLEFDDKSDLKDKYDRYLAWVFIDDSLLQNDLISKGYAKVAYLYGDYEYTDELKVSEKTALNNKIGIWSDYEKSNNYIYYIVIGLGVILLLIINPKKLKRIIKKSIVK